MRRVVGMTLLALVAAAAPACAQSSEIEALRKEIAALREDLETCAPASGVPATVIDLTKGHQRGSADALVALIEFSDYECPFCIRHSRETMPLIEKNYIATGKILYGFRDFPIDQLHPQAIRAHQAAQCAGDQDKYWEMHNRMFGQSSQHTPQALEAAATQAGLNLAKFRAARRMWARIMRDRFGASNKRSMMCRFHVQTAGSSLTARSIDNNVVRTTVQALAAVLGGAQSLHTNSRDEALALPTAEAARLALRTQQIMAFETGVADTPDPLAGSYLVATLTDELEAAAQTYLDQIDGIGGTLAAIEAGFQQREIQEAAYRIQREIEAGDRIVVGVNRFEDEQSSTPPLLRVDAEAERRQVERPRPRPGSAESSSARLGFLVLLKLNDSSLAICGKARRGMRLAGSAAIFTVALPTAAIPLSYAQTAPDG